MITDLANLGPSFTRTPDLGVKQKADDKGFAETLANTNPKPTTRPESPEPRMAPQETASRETETVRTNNDGEKLVVKTAELQAKSKPQTREQAMLQFMDSMESELSIPPTSIVEAMAELPADAQVESPTDTASQVIGQLSDEFGLSKEEQERAMQLYSGLLQKINTLPQQAVNPTMFEGQNTRAALMGSGAGAVALNSKDRRAMLNDSLDRMNSKFFMHEAKAQIPTSENILEVPKTRNGLEAYQNMKADSPLAMQALQNQQADLVANQAEQPMGLKAQSAQQSDQGYEGVTKALAALGAAAAALEQPAVKAEAQSGMAQLPEADLAELNGSAIPNKGAIPMNANLGQNLKFGSDSEAGLWGETDSELNELSSEKSEFRMPEVALHKDHVPRAETLGAAAMGAKAITGEALSGTAERVQNVQQIMNQANYMIKNGGGEANIVLNPEGLGQVHLKVVVDSGKVDVQMSADTVEAKKLLESSMHDLKQSLSQRNLSLDGLKVDVGSNLSSDLGKNDSQSQMNFNGDGSRDQAQKFMSQFREENLARRDGSWDASAMRGPRAPRAVDPLQPAPVNSSAIKRYQGQSKGQSIDRVA